MSKRYIYFLGWIAIVILLSFSFYLQFFDGIMPCPLCMLQRIAFALLGILFFLGIFLYAKRIYCFILNTLLLLTSSLGMLFAGRQIWLQHVPSNTNECGVTLQYMMQALPITEVMQKIFEGSAECTQRGWELASLNMAEWALVWFIFFFLMSLYLLFKKVW